MKKYDQNQPTTSTTSESLWEGFLAARMQFFYMERAFY
jgi:hypothetical protein